MCKSIKAIICFFVILCLVGSQSAIAETIYYYHTDPVGTPLAMTDEAGAKVWEADYLPFGEVHTESGLLNDRKFVGKERDEESDLDYFGARFHYAKVGRFLAVDPVKAVNMSSSQLSPAHIMNPQKLNTYAYSQNNPYKFIDPDGRDYISLLDKTAVQTQGHTARITGPVNGKWRYDSFGKPGSAERHGVKSGFNSEQEAMAFAKDKGYTDYARYKTTESQDKVAQEEADKWHSGFAGSYRTKPGRDYFFNSRNCQSLGNAMADAAKIKGFTPRSVVGIPHPRLTFDENTRRGIANEYGAIK